jgi:hypothetical protein
MHCHVPTIKTLEGESTIYQSEFCYDRLIFTNAISFVQAGPKYKNYYFFFPDMTTMDYLNPWNAANCIQDYNFYCCPECVYRSKSEGDFQIHATCNHPESKVFFDRLEGRIDPISVKSEQVVVEYDAKVLEHLKTDNDLEDELEPQKPDLIDQPRVHPVNFQPNALYAVFSGEKFSGIVQKV